MKFNILNYIFVFALIGCANFKNLNPKFKKISSTLPLQITDNGIFTSIGIGDDNYSFVVDTGASTTFITNSKIVNEKEPYASKKYKSFGKSYNSELYTLESNNSLFQSNNYSYSYNTRSRLCQSYLYDGIIGSDFLNFDQFYVVHFDLSNNKIKLFDSVEEIPMNEYLEVKSKFFELGYHVQIALSINGTEEFFHFDTGNMTDYGILVIDKNTKINLNKQMYIRKGMRKDSSKASYVIYNEDVMINGLPLKNTLVIKPDHFKDRYNNVGFKFIRNFNWVIDYRNKRVYFKPRERFDSTNNLTVRNKTIIMNSKELRISLVNQKDEEKFPLGSKVISVNGEKIDSLNLCKNYYLLNSTDWTSLNLEIQKP